jgi:hypothetical protein
LQSTPQQGGVLDAARQGATSFLGGLNETAKRYAGIDTGLDKAANAIAPTAQADATLYDDKGLHLENAGNALAESATPVAASIAAARLTPGPLWAKLAAAGIVGLGSMAGNAARDATVKRTGDANASSSPEDLQAGLVRSAPQAAIMSLPVGRFLGGASAGLGARGVLGSLARGSVDAAAMGTAGAVANAYDQFARGDDVSPTEVLNAGLTQGLAGAAAGAGRTIGDTRAAVKYRALADEDPAHITEAAKRIQAANANLNGDLRSPSAGYNALRSAQSDVGTALKAAVDQLNGYQLSPLSTRALARSQTGLPLGDNDVASLAADTGNHPAVGDLQRLMGVLRVLRGVENTGIVDDDRGTFVGRASPLMSGLAHTATHHTLGSAAYLAGLGHPAGAAGVLGAVALARIHGAVKAAVGRSPASAFARRFDP